MCLKLLKVVKSKTVTDFIITSFIKIDSITNFITMIKKLKKESLITLGLGLAGWDMKLISQCKEKIIMRSGNIFTPLLSTLR